jgi:hypothetical protein
VPSTISFKSCGHQALDYVALNRAVIGSGIMYGLGVPAVRRAQVGERDVENNETPRNYPQPAWPAWPSNPPDYPHRAPGMGIPTAGQPGLPHRRATNERRARHPTAAGGQVVKQTAFKPYFSFFRLGFLPDLSAKTLQGMDGYLCATS